MYRASVAQSVAFGRSPFSTALSNRFRNTATIDCLNWASSRRTASASSPQASAPDTTRHPRALSRSRCILMNPEKTASTTARAVGFFRASVRNDMGPIWYPGWFSGRQNRVCASDRASIGNAVTQLARALGAKHAMSSTTNHAKAEQAMALGFNEVIDTSMEKLGDGVRRITDGYGADIVIDGIGGEILSEALGALASEGTRLLADDFAFGASGSVYITTYPQHTLVRLEPSGAHTTLAGPEQGMIGSTACAFGRAPGDENAIYVTIDGGFLIPHESGIQDAKLVRMEVGESGWPLLQGA